MYRPNLSVVCFFICLSYFIFYCALLLFCAQAWHGKTLSSWNDPIFFCSLHWRNLSLYNKITTTHFKQIRFWWKNVIKFRGKVYSNFFKFVQQLFFLSVLTSVRYCIYLSFCLSICHSIYGSICPSLYLSFYFISLCLSNVLCPCVVLCLFRSVSLVCHSVYLSAYLSFYHSTSSVCLLFYICFFMSMYRFMSNCCYVHL